MSIKTISLLISLFAFSAISFAQPDDAKQNPCKYGEQFQRLDFWLGDWDVYVKDVKIATSSITKSEDGCTLYEDYKTFSGYLGRSTNYYDPTDKKYTQIWIDKFNGIILFKELSAKNGYLQMEAISESDTLKRMTYVLDANSGHVAQTIEASLDQGKTWVPNFIGVYKRKNAGSNDVSSNFIPTPGDTILILPGSKLIDGTKIKPYINKWKVSYVASDGKSNPYGIWTDYGQVIELEDKKYLHRTQDLHDSRMDLQDTWTNLVEWETLRPVRFSTNKSTGAFSNYSFEGNQVTGSSNLKSKGLAIDSINATLSSAVFDWNLYGMLLVGLPLKKGLLAKMPFYDAATNSQQWLLVNVEEKEVLQLQHIKKPITSWKISTNQELTFWISESAPYVIKLELELKDGAKLLWEAF